MSLDHTKLQLVKWIVADENQGFLPRLSDYVDDLNFEKESAKKVLGLRANGTEVTKAELLRCVRLSEEQQGRGEIYSLEDLEKDAEIW